MSADEPVEQAARRVVREWSNLTEPEAAAVVAALRDAGLLGGQEAVERVRALEEAMARRASEAWHNATARHGLSDQPALEQHADTLTRWSERLRMALRGDLTGDEEWMRP